MQFYNSQYLIALWSLAIVALIFILAAKIRQKRLAQLGTLKTVLRMSTFSAKNRRRKNLALFLALALGLIALSQPQWGTEKKQLERKGVDIIFLLDTSLSMLAQDTKPSRLEKAKLEIRSFVKKFKGDRIGLIAFAGSSFLQCPLTLDYAAFFLFLDAINVGYIPDPGSSLQDALENAIHSFPSGEKRHRVIIIFSDGEFHGESLKSLAGKSIQEGITIYCIGLGTAEGEPIPLKTEGGKVVAYKKDNAGNMIVSKLNEGTLASLAKQGNGLYYPATANEQEIGLIYKDMQKLGKKKLKSRMLTEREDHYQLFLLIALLLLTLSALASERRRKEETAT